VVVTGVGVVAVVIVSGRVVSFRFCFVVGVLLWLVVVWRCVVLCYQAARFFCLREAGLLRSLVFVVVSFSFFPVVMVSLWPVVVWRGVALWLLLCYTM